VKNASAFPRSFSFGVFELNPQCRELRKQGLKISLQVQPVEILARAFQQRGEIVTRDELQRNCKRNSGRPTPLWTSSRV
jgi:DNA-binding response OmpR family regulator